MMRRKRIIGRVTVGLVLVGALAHAGGEDAEGLFVQGNALVNEGRYAEACPKLAESERLEPAIGTRFNLADCYEHLGRTATAHTMFVDVARSAHAAGKFERERLAKGRAAALVPRLARLRIDVRAPSSGLEVVLDDVVLPRNEWSEERVIDPGHHRVSAKASGRTPWSLDATVREAVVTVVLIPELAPASKEAASPSAPSALSAPSGKGQRTLALALGGLAATGLIVGGIGGAVALSSRSRAEQLCPESTYRFRCPTESGADAWSSASTAGNVATVAFIAGGVALAAAAVVWLTAPSARASASLGAWRF